MTDDPKPSLRAALAEEEESLRLCFVGKFLQSLDADDRAALEAALLSDMSAGSLERRLNKAGITHIKNAVISKHRRRMTNSGCSCPV